MITLSLLSFFPVVFSDIWSQLYLNPLDEELNFTLLLKQKNTHILEQELIDRSDPYSKNYAKWLTNTEINTIIQPDDYTPVIKSLQVNNISYTAHIDNIKCEGTVKNIQNFFQTTIHGNTASLPPALSPHIDMVLGSSDHYNRPQFSPESTPYKDGDMSISPESLARLYNISYPKPKSVSSQSVAEFLGDSCYNNDDLQTFLNASNIPNISISKEHFWGSCSPTTSDPDIEATLDIQYQTGVNPYTELYYISVSDWLYQFANKVYSSESPPKVISISYGWAEWDQCDTAVFPTCLLNTTAEDYTVRTNVEFIKLGLRGITLVASSGDAGAPGRTDEECDQDNMLNPAFPASSPWVLAVGGTIITKPVELENPKTPLCQTNTCIGGGVELNCNFDRCGWTSGGGFSNFFYRPAWQAIASRNYLKSGATFPPNKYFNSSGRVYPDISLVAHNYLIKGPGGYMHVDGTSASGPSVSGMVSILNNLRVSNGKSTLGPVAPLLYSLVDHCPTCFNDIVVGSNNSTEESSCKWGYQATKGFDAVYGLGTPNFKAIYSYVAQL